MKEVHVTPEGQELATNTAKDMLDHIDTKSTKHKPYLFQRLSSLVNFSMALKQIFTRCQQGNIPSSSVSETHLIG